MLPELRAAGRIPLVRPGGAGEAVVASPLDCPLDRSCLDVDRATGAAATPEVASTPHIPALETPCVAFAS